jgi:hypothetical protein
MYTYGKSDPSVRYKFQGITALVAVSALRTLVSNSQ